MEIRGRRACIFELAPPPSVDEDSFNQLSATSVGENNSISSQHPSTLELSVAAGAADDSRTNFDALFEAAAAGTMSAAEANGAVGVPGAASATPATNNITSQSGGGSGGNDRGEGEHEILASVQELLRVTEEGMAVSGGGMGPLEWSWLSREEALEKARKLYREAAHAQVRHKPRGCRQPLVG